MSTLWIGTLNESAGTWGEAILRACLQGAVLALLAWAICRLWKRMPPSICCGIWLLVFLKVLIALCPVALSLPVLPAEKQAAIAPLATAPSTIDFASMPVGKVALETPSLSLGTYLFTAWVLGVIGILAFTAFVLLRLKRLVRAATPITNPSLVADAKQLATQMGIKRVPTLLQTDSEIEVLTYGALRPRILISRSTLSRCSADDLRLILAHELAHVKRHDAWVALMPQVATTLCFFNPFVWFAAREFELAREGACDELAIRSLNARSDIYGRLLLRLSSRRDFAASFFVLGISSHFRVLSRRIAMLNRISTEKPRRNGAFAVMGLIGALLVAPWTLVRAQATPPTDEPKPKPPASQNWKPRNSSKKPTSTLWRIPKSANKSSTKWTRIMVYRLKYKSAEEVRETLSKMVRDHSVKLTADHRTNSIYVSGPDAPSEELIRIARSLDKKPAQNSEVAHSETYIVVLHEGRDVVSITKKLTAEFRATYPASKLSLVANAKDHLITIDAEPSIAKKVVDRIRLLDKEEAPEPQVSTERKKVRIPLQYADASVVASRVVEELKEKLQGKNFSIFAEPAGKAIVVDAAPEIILEVQARIQALDRLRVIDPRVLRPNGNLTRKFPVKVLDAPTAMNELQKLLVQPSSIDFLTYDPTDNTIVARGNEADLDALSKVLKTLDHKS